MADLPREPAGAQQELPTAHDSPADPRPQGHQDHVVRPPPGPVHTLAPARAGGVVLHRHRNSADALAHPATHIELGDTWEVGGEAQPAGPVHQARSPDPQRGRHRTSARRTSLLALIRTTLFTAFR